MKVLSLFDGMSCGMLAMMAAGVQVERYDAYEIDKYAVTASKHNFPQIEHHGDVFKADFTAYRGYDFLVGGSPCTYWSIAQRPDKRETVASGIGWELFSQYVRALHEARPRMFIYENNKSMSKDIRASITAAFGFEPICINSALVSAQNRQRLYWVGVRNEDGAYRKASIEQPADRGILLKDVLDSAQPFTTTTTDGKSFACVATYWRGSTVKDTITKHRRTMCAEPACVASRGRNPDDPSSRIAGDPTEQRFEAHEDGKTNTLTSVSKDNLIAEPAGVECVGVLRNSQGYRIHGIEGKNQAVTVQSGGPGGASGLIAEPTALQEQPYGRTANADGQYDRRYEAKTDGKSAALTSVESRRIVAEPIPEVPLHDKMYTLDAQYGKTPGTYNPHSQHSYSRHAVAVPQEPQRIGEIANSQGSRIYSPDAKSVALASAEGGHARMTGLYATTEQPKNSQRAYEVKDGMIEVNGKRYPIKLRDGRYIIRKLTVTECMRLQTVPGWYDFSCVSNTQAYKMLGNGWTVEVIAHLIRGAIKSSVFGI